MVLSKNTQENTLPLMVKKHIQDINIFIVENIRTTRRYIKSLCKEKNIDKITFYPYDKHQNLNLDKDFLPHILNGDNIALMSEAGLPCIADPGSQIVDYAHEHLITIVPISGPSSIFLALMASGMNGQNFAFNGYLPINKSERSKAILHLERLSKTKKQTQIFMETPYRNQQLFDNILRICSQHTKLCIASNITAKNELIQTKTVSEWKNNKINIHKQPTIFLME